MFIHSDRQQNYKIWTLGDNSVTWEMIDETLAAKRKLHLQLKNQSEKHGLHTE